ncbi:hypothetical protein CLV97_10172 [Planifilum fimeticola]|uniref:Uncharacterized protein n=2 Tax=Planifilum fimeticola TaxID=201975 RepID=A0A2T0LJA5_9BACL|nr:hypothetical protein CLV97_10172 [Planifilum fimeticola]
MKAVLREKEAAVIPPLLFLFGKRKGFSVGFRTARVQSRLITGTLRQMGLREFRR